MVSSNSTSQVSPKQRFLCCPTLPLSVYREVAAHLRQVNGINAGLVPQSSSQFDYVLSQVGSLWIEYADDVDTADRDRVDRILAYYSDRYGTWGTVGDATGTALDKHGETGTR